MDSKDVDYDKYVNFLGIFKDMNVFEAKGHIEGMKGEIETFLVDEQRSRGLDTLKPKWLDDVTPAK